MRISLLLFILFFAINKASHAQTEGTIVEVKLAEKGHSIGNKDSTLYHVYLTHPFQAHLYFNDGRFRIAKIHWYEDEQVKLLIVTAKDTMQVSFRANFQENHNKPTLVTRFKLLIPFRKGSYEIPHLQLIDDVYMIPRSYKW